MTARLSPGRYLGRSKLSFEAGTGLRVVSSRYDAGTSLPRHEHPHAHLCVVLAGTYEEHLGRRSFVRDRLDAVWYPSGVDHAERHGPRGHHLILDVEGSLADGAPADVRAVDVPVVFGAALKLAATLRDPDADEDLDRRALALELLAAVSRPEPARHSAPTWLSRVERHLHEQFRRPLALAELARIPGVDEAHLARTWRRVHGETLGESLRRRRVLAACRALRPDGAPISQVALDAGFTDQSHLGRVFRRLVGTTPARFRRALASA